MNVNLLNSRITTDKDEMYKDFKIMPLEFLMGGEEYTMQGDIWLMGILFFQLLTFNYPFAGNNIKALIRII